MRPASTLAASSRTVVAGKRPDTKERFVERHRKGELVAARIGGLAPPLLGRHVRWGADQHPGRRHRQRTCRARRIERLVAERDRSGCAREAEVTDANAPVLAHQDVVRFEVAVHEAGTVRRGQATAGSDHDVDHGTPSGARVVEPAPERDPVDELHRDEELVAHPPDVVHGDDVGVGELGHGLRFQDQPRAPLDRSGRGLGTQQLERHLSIELGIVRDVHDTHAALAEPLDQAVPTHRRKERRGLDVRRRRGAARRYQRGQLGHRRRRDRRPVEPRELRDDGAARSTHVEVELEDAPIGDHDPTGREGIEHPGIGARRARSRVALHGTMLPV
jgi:hypothetical protein